MKTKKTESIPNSLIIFIKTRIPNYHKFNYEPYMTVPSSKSQTVFFDPLVKYYSGPIQNLPSSNSNNNISKDLLYTQFFQSNEFDSMINRILSDFRYMQKPRTLKQATEEKIIDNNIQITLDTLFKQNGLIYINKQPYAIVGKHWKKGSWQLDSKPIDQLLAQNTYLSLKDIEQMANEEKDDIPESLRQGNAVSANLVQEEIAGNVASGIKDIIDSNNNNNKNSNNQQQDTDRKPLESNKETLDNMSREFRDLFGSYLEKNNPINYSTQSDLIRDPLIFSLVIDYDTFFKYLQSNQKIDIIKNYSAYLETKKALKNLEQKFEDIRTEIALKKKIFNKESDNNFNSLMKIKSLSGGAINYENIRSQGENGNNNINTLIDDIFNNKMEYMQQILKLAESLNDIYNAQKIYFETLLMLLNNLKTVYAEDYETLIPYFEAPDLVLKCIDFDIQTVRLLIYNNDENKYSTSYFHNVEKFTKYLSILKEKEASTLKRKFNYKEQIEIYLSDPGILYIEKEQYDLYSFNILLNHSYNQFDIWMLYYKSIELFVSAIRSFCLHLVEIANTNIHEYKSILDNNGNNSALYTSILDETIGVKASRNMETRTIDSWNFVKKDDSMFHFQPNSPEYKFEKAYIDMIKSSVKSFDCIILYLYLSEIKCLRNTKLYIAELNVEQLNISYFEKLRQYYISIDKSVRDAKQSLNTPYIPPTILWDVSKSWDFSKLDDASKLLDESFLTAKKKKNDKSITIHMNRIGEIKASIKDISRSCDSLYDSIFPSISKTLIINQCTNLFDNLDSMPTYTPRNSYWLEREIEGYNPERSIELNLNMTEIVRMSYYDKVIDTRTPKGYQDWIVYTNEGNGDCFFASIREALNGQMDVENAITNNVYTDPVLIDGTTYNRYTINSLRRLVSDNFTEDIYENYCGIFGTGMTVDGKCDLDLTIVEDDLDSNIKPIYKLFVTADANGNKMIRSLEEVKKYISESCSTNSGCFWADQVAINIIQHVLKIKLIIFEMFVEAENDIRVGDLVNYNDGKGDDYVVIHIDLKENIAIIQNTASGIEENIDKDMLVLSDYNITKNFRLNCSGLNLNDHETEIKDESEEIKDYIFLVFTNIQPPGEPPVYHYEFVRNTGSNNFIYNFEEIPEYVKYFIYNSCHKYLSQYARKNTGFGKIKEFQEYFEKIDEKNTIIMQEKRLGHETNLHIQDLKNKKIQQINLLDQRMKSAMDQKTKEIIKRDMTSAIKNIDKEISNLEEDLKNTKYEKKYATDIIHELEDKLQQIDSDFVKRQSDISEPELETERIMVEKEKESIQSEIDRLQKHTIMTGGAYNNKPKYEYSQNQMYNNSRYNNPIYNNPRYNNPIGYNYPPNNYPYQHPYSNPYLNPYSHHYGMYPGNKYVNKIKESKSKLAYYITIELELYPGKTANMLQKSVVKCQSTFEKIREAYAEIRGFDYRPLPMSEAYGYNSKFNKNINKNNNNTKNRTNKYQNKRNKRMISNNTRRLK
jgi:hypothetical protein